MTASMIEVATNHLQRERSRSPRRRSRSPRRSRRSYSPRSRSRSRDRERDEYRRSERRSRSPMTSGAGASGGYSGSGYGRGGGAAVPARSFEERAQAKEQMMASVRESSQQERRVYVGNLSYDVKWHHLKDFMRQGQYYGPVLVSSLLTFTLQLERFSLPMCYYFRMECRRWAPMRRCGWSFWFLLVVGRWIDGLGRCPRVM